MAVLQQPKRRKETTGDSFIIVSKQSKYNKDLCLHRRPSKYLKPF